VKKGVCPTEKARGSSPCVIVPFLLHDGRCLFQQKSFDGLTRGSGRNMAVAHHGPTRLTVS
jgi:hypothetical protein